MEDRLDFRLQIHSGHRLRHPISDGGHAEHPHSCAACLGDFHGLDRRWEELPEDILFQIL